MANEKKGTAQGTEKVTETKNGNLVIVRKPIVDEKGNQLISKDNHPLYAYMVCGYIRGQEKKIDFAPKDQGGYEPLDILFDMTDKAELIMSDEVMVNDDGTKTPYVSYKVQTVDEDGEIWDCGVKPQRDSDKVLLKFLLISLRKEQKKAQQNAAATV